MPRASLKRLLRGETRDAVASVAALLPSPVRVEDERGRALLGDATEGDRHPVRSAGEEVGAVIGGEGAARIAALLAAMCEREEEKLALADETLGRYKELTLLHAIGEKLALVLEVEEVASLVVEEARAFLGARSAVLYLVDATGGVLEPVASTGGAPAKVRVANAGVEGRALATGRAELVEDVASTAVGRHVEPGVRSLLCAPLRSGEEVFGLLRLVDDRPAAWNAGHLKLVTSLVGHAASAMRHAMLHRARLREQALRLQAERYASASLCDLALGEAKGRRAVPVFFADLGELARRAASALGPEALAAIVERATSVALALLFERGATVEVTQGEVIVALFAADAPFADLAARAASAATALARATARRLGGFAEASPGVGVTHAELGDGAGLPELLAAVSRAADLERAARGRVFVDERIAAELGDAARPLPPHDAGAAHLTTRAFEVRS
jgi:class 3 adenylate cyclase